MLGDKGRAAIKALLLIALSFFLYGRIASGTLYFYISQRFAVFTLAAVVGLFILAISYGRVQRDRAPHSHNHDDGHCDDECCHHDHSQHEHIHHRLTWIGAAIVMAPVVLGLIFPPAPLGASALANRELSPSQSTATITNSVNRTANKSPAEYNILDWNYRFLGGADATEFADVNANVAGFVYHDETLDADAFWLVRYTVSCCVADAAAVSLQVKWPDAPTLSDDQWVQIEGPFSAAQDGRGYPVLVAENVQLIPTPNQPYLYP